MSQRMKLIVIGLSVTLAIITAFFVMTTEASVGLKVRYDEEVCSAEYPLVVEVTNRSIFSLQSYSFRIIGKRPGYSSLVTYNSDLFSSDKIIAALSSQASCWIVPTGKFMSPEKVERIRSEAPSLEWTAHVDDFSQKFFGLVRLSRIHR